MWRGHRPHGRGVSGELLGDKDKEDRQQRWKNYNLENYHLDFLICRVTGWFASTDSDFYDDSVGDHSLRHLVPYLYEILLVTTNQDRKS